MAHERTATRTISLLASLIAMALALLLCAGCSYESYELGAPEDVGDSSDTWTVLVYMCGSDLESEAGLATDNLIELTGSELGNNVNFVIQTGGASKWRNNIITAKIKNFTVHLDNFVDEVYAKFKIEQLDSYRASGENQQ